MFIDIVAPIAVKSSIRCSRPTRPACSLVDIGDECVLKAKCHMSFSAIVEFLRDVFGLMVCRGFLAMTIVRAFLALAAHMLSYVGGFGVRLALDHLRSRRAETAADPRVRRGFSYGLHGAGRCAKVTYYFHGQAAGEVLLDNLRWEKR